MEYIGPNMNANSGNYNYYSGDAKVSFDGFINENYFLLEAQEKNLVQNLEITHAIVKNPITYNKEAFIGLFLKSKYDGLGNRRPFNFSIALDISGSMDQYESGYPDPKQRITLAKESLIKLVSIMDVENDKMSLITFNHEAKKIFGLLKKSEIEGKFLNDVASIRASGGTDLVEALKAAMDNLNINDKENRIIMITDVDYNDHNDKLLKLFKECVEEKNISITIIAISRNSVLSLADKVCQFKGCNYFSITKSSELEKFMIKNFNYIFFPIAHEIKLTIKSENSSILKCIGGYNELPLNFSHEDDGVEPPNASKEISFDIGSAFSSELIKIDNKIYIKGGLILLKINADDLNKNEDLKFDFSFEYTSFVGNRSCQNYSYIIKKKKEENTNFFKDNNIKKGISIYYFCVILNYIVEVENKRNYKYIDSKKTEMKKIKDLELLETKQAVSDFLNNNFVIEPNNQEMKDNLANYLNIIKDRYTKYQNIIYDFYELVKPKGF